MKYQYNDKAGGVRLDWIKHSTIPGGWQGSEQKFKCALQVELSPITGEVYAAWAWDKADSRLFVYLLGDSDWHEVRATSEQQIAAFLLPPVETVPLEIAGSGCGWGIFSDQLIEAADLLRAEQTQH